MKLIPFMQKSNVSKILENLNKVKHVFLVEEHEISYLYTFFEALYDKFKNTDGYATDSSISDEENEITHFKKKDYLEEFLSEFCATTYHKESINQLLSIYINTQNNKKIIKVIKLYKNFANLKFFGLIWNYIFSFDTIPEFEEIYQEISSVLKLKLKFLQNNRLYGDYYSSQESNLINNNQNHTQIKKIKKCIDNYHKSILEGNIERIPMTLFYLTKYFKQDLDDSNTDNYKLFVDIIEITRHIINNKHLFTKSINTQTNIIISFSKLFINGTLEKNYKNAINLLENSLNSLIEQKTYQETKTEEYNYYLFLLNYYIGQCYYKTFKLEKADIYFKQALQSDKHFKYSNKSEIYYKIARMNLFGWGVEINYNTSYTSFIKSKELMMKNSTINNNYYAHKSAMTLLNRVEFKKKIEEEKKCFNICHICQKNEKKTLAIPCGHKYSCELCYDNQIFNSKTANLRCESCDGHIESIIKVFY